jgi:hypothetical protein
VLGFKVTSQSDATQFADAVIGVRILARPEPQVEADTFVKPVEPDSEVAFSVEVRNAGNIKDTFSLEFEVDEATSPGAEQWDVDVEPASVELQPGTTASATLRIQSPAGLVSGTDQVVVTLTAVSGSHPSERSSDPLTFTAFPSYPNLVISDLDWEPETVYHGLPATLLLEVANHGTQELPGATTVLVRVLEDGAPVQPDRMLEVPALDWQGPDNTVVYEVPLQTDASGLLVRVTVDPADIIDEQDEADNLADLSIPIRQVDIELTGPGDVDGEPGLALAFEGQDAVRIRNNGEHAEDVRVVISSSPAWVGKTAMVNNLGPGAVGSVPINFIIPEAPSVEEAVVSIRAEIQGVPSVSTADEFVVRVRDTDGPVISDVTLEAAEVGLGQSVNVTATISDRLGVGTAKAVSVAPSGITRSFDMEATDGAPFRASITLDSVGTYKVYVWAEDGSKAENSADTLSSPLSLRVVPSGAPELQAVNFAPDDTLRPGTPLLVDVLTAAPIQTALFALNGTTTPLLVANPLQIATDGWADGPHDFLVTVEDSYGESGEQDFSVRIDGTAPRIVHLGLNATNPSVGRLAGVVAGIVDDSAIKSVILRVHRFNATTQDILMQRIGSQNFSADVTWDDGIDRLTVIAEDIVGNRGSAERSFASGRAAEGGNSLVESIPGIGLWGTLAALGAIAAGRMRRVRGEE